MCSLQVMQVWYLLGWAWHLRQDADLALEALLRAKALFESNACEEEDVLKHINELLSAYPPQQPADD